MQHIYNILMMTHWKKYLMLFISYFLGCKSEDAVHQNIRVETADEGADVIINCSYTTTDPLPTLFWYQQKVNGFPKHMLSTYGNNEDEFKKRFNARLNKLTKSAPLTIQDLRVSDSAVYYCALRPTVTETHSALIQKLCVCIHKFGNITKFSLVFFFFFFLWSHI
uniref:Ig-like domain-containing protein n=1 Tax=Cyprinus carpio TaxID=7962 RepID=A0A8C1UBC8_CYPCA